LEEGASVFNGELHDDHNCLEDFAMTSDVVVIDLRQDAPGLEASVYRFVTRTDMGLHPLIGGRISGVVRALHLVDAANVAIVGFNALAGIKPVVAQDLVEDLDVVEDPAGYGPCIHTRSPPKMLTLIL
jgi:hypothetical protein